MSGLQLILHLNMQQVIYNLLFHGRCLHQQLRQQMQRRTKTNNV